MIKEDSDRQGDFQNETVVTDYSLAKILNDPRPGDVLYDRMGTYTVTQVENGRVTVLEETAEDRGSLDYPLERFKKAFSNNILVKTVATRS